jgi:hypothetical protein
MNLKVKAMIYTVGLISAIFAGSLTMTYLLSLMTPQTGMWLLIAGLFGLFIYTLYGIIFSQLASQEELAAVNRSVDKS